MDNKKLGLMIIGLSILFSLLLWAFTSQISQFNADSCTSTCDSTHEPPFLTHAGIALIFATLSLGGYLLFFEKSQQVLIRKLKKDESQVSAAEKFKYLMMGLNDDERKVLSAIKEQEGITQNTLRIRINFHKSKLSILVGILEEKGLIKKEKKGKTNILFLRFKL